MNTSKQLYVLDANSARVQVFELPADSSDDSDEVCVCARYGVFAISVPFPDSQKLTRAAGAAVFTWCFRNRKECL